VAATALLSWLATSLLWALASALVGMHPTVVSSGSMAPRIRPGDVVVATPARAGPLRPGTVLLVDDPERPGLLLLHRLLRRTSEGLLVTKGDANARPDPAPVATAAVRGVARLRISYVGLPKLWLAERRWPLLAAFTAAVAALVVAARAPATR